MNLRSALTVVCVCSVLLLANPDVEGRVIAIPSYRTLLERSDIVVIARPTAVTETKDRIDLPGSTSDRKGVSGTGVATTFRVSAVLKGDKELKEFVLHHYRLAFNGTGLPFAIINGPGLVHFDPSKDDRYLLFLVREKDGRYAPTAGQVDPDGISIIHLKGSPD